MSRFNVGDVVRYRNEYICAMPSGYVNSFIVQEVFPSRTSPYFLLPAIGKGSTSPTGLSCWESPEQYLELIKSVNTIKKMSLVSRFVGRFTPEPQKTFRKLQVTNSSDELTSDGTALLLNYLLTKHQDDFKTEVCDPLLKEQEEEAKK